MSKRDTSSPEYRSALSSSLRWDAERKEPYLQLPSFPDLRLTLFREGIVDDLVSPFNSPRLHLISSKGHTVQPPRGRSTPLPLTPPVLPLHSSQQTLKRGVVSACPDHSSKNGSNATTRSIKISSSLPRAQSRPPLPR